MNKIARETLKELRRRVTGKVGSGDGPWLEATLYVSPTVEEITYMIKDLGGAVLWTEARPCSAGATNQRKYVVAFSLGEHGNDYIMRAINIKQLMVLLGGGREGAIHETNRVFTEGGQSASQQP